MIHKEPINDFYIYKETFGQQVVSAAYALLIPRVITFFMAGLIFTLKPELLCFWFVFILPILPIHINYLKEDSGKTVKINYIQKILIVSQYNKKIKIPFEEIDTIMINYHPFRRQVVPWGNYKYARFNLKNGGYFIITRFILNFDEELFTLIKTTEKNRTYPMIKEEGKMLL